MKAFLFPMLFIAAIGFLIYQEFEPEADHVSTINVSALQNPSSAVEISANEETPSVSVWGKIANFIEENSRLDGDSEWESEWYDEESESAQHVALNYQDGEDNYHDGETEDMRDVDEYTWEDTETDNPVLSTDAVDWDPRDIQSIMGNILGGVIKEGVPIEATADSPTNDNFTFPDIIDDGTGELVMRIADEPLPGRSGRRMLSVGDGDEVRLGDKVKISYDMFSWATGELIESTRDFENETLDITIGDHEIPNELQNALLNQPVGSRMQVVFEKSLSDLSPYMNKHDGYVLVVDIQETLTQ